MPDTSLEVPPDKRKRLARPRPNDPIDGKPQQIALPDSPIKWHCGGACAFGTVG